MTPRKRWPECSELARTEGIKLARGIARSGGEAKEAVRRGDRLIALVLIAEMQIAAQQIEAGLLAAKNPQEREA
jgi:hypothetical protein